MTATLNIQIREERMNPRDCVEEQPEATAGMPMKDYPSEAKCAGMEEKPHRPTAQRRHELMHLALGIAAQVQACTKRGRERCLLRQMVEMFLDD